MDVVAWMDKKAKRMKTMFLISSVILYIHVHVYVIYILFFNKFFLLPSPDLLTLKICGKKQILLFFVVI